MEAKNIEWNKDIPFYELPLILNTNLSDDTLQWINDRYNFLIHNIPVFVLFYNINGSINYKNYECKTETIYNFKEDLDSIIFKYNIVRDKKICLIIDLSKKSNYHQIRYTYIDIENNLTIKCLKPIIRKEKIRLLLNNIEMKNCLNSIDSNNILTEATSSLHI